MFHPVAHPMERGWVGRVDGENVVELAAQTLQAYFTGGGAAREHAQFPLSSVRLLAPVLHPPAVRVFEDESSFEFANPAAIMRAEHRGRSPHRLGLAPAGAATARRRGDRRPGSDRRLHDLRGVARAGSAAAEGPRLRARARPVRGHAGRGARRARRECARLRGRRARGKRRGIRVGGGARLRRGRHDAEAGRRPRRPRARRRRAHRTGNGDPRRDRGLGVLSQSVHSHVEIQ